MLANSTDRFKKFLRWNCGSPQTFLRKFMLVPKMDGDLLVLAAIEQHFHEKDLLCVNVMHWNTSRWDVPEYGLFSPFVCILGKIGWVPSTWVYWLRKYSFVAPKNEWSMRISCRWACTPACLYFHPALRIDTERNVATGSFFPGCANELSPWVEFATSNASGRLLVDVSCNTKGCGMAFRNLLLRQRTNRFLLRA